MSFKGNVNRVLSIMRFKLKIKSSKGGEFNLTLEIALAIMLGVALVSFIISKMID